ESAETKVFVSLRINFETRIRLPFLASKERTKEKIGSVGMLPAIQCPTTPRGAARRQDDSNGKNVSRDPTSLPNETERIRLRFCFRSQADRNAMPSIPRNSFEVRDSANP